MVPSGTESHFGGSASSEQLVWQPESAAEPFVLDLPAFFAEVLHEYDDEAE